MLHEKQAASNNINTKDNEPEVGDSIVEQPKVMKRSSVSWLLTAFIKKCSDFPLQCLPEWNDKSRRIQTIDERRR